MSNRRFVARTLIVTAAAVLIFLAGVTVERSGHNPIPGAVPVVGDTPTRGILKQDGEPTCSLTRYGYNTDEGCPLVVGKGFRVSHHTVREGWTLKPGDRGPVLTMTVANDNPGAIGSFTHTVHLERFDGTLVEIVWCTEDEKPFTAGESRAVTCEPLSPEGNEPFDNVRIIWA